MANLALGNESSQSTLQTLLSSKSPSVTVPKALKALLSEQQGHAGEVSWVGDQEMLRMHHQATDAKAVELILVLVRESQSQHPAVELSSSLGESEQVRASTSC